MSRKQNIWRVITGQGIKSDEEAVGASDMEGYDVGALEIPPDDPLMVYLVNSPGVVEIEKLEFDSPALQSLRRAGVRIAVPLISHGDLVGILNLGPRLSEQEYNPDDARLLENLAGQAAPALRVAQLARQQQIEAAERERIEQEMQVASLIQHTLLPKSVPEIDGWGLGAFYQPARAVGGDYYDFMNFPDGKLGIVIGDVTDKGVPAAMVMATTRSMIRTAAEQYVSPSQVLEKVNDTLVEDIPPNMFVTLLYALLDPNTGQVQYANAGHDLPYRREQDGISELRATGMPLGLMPQMTYEEKEITLAPGESVLFYSDGLVEAHNPAREMFGFPRLRGLIASHSGGADMIDYLLNELQEFTGEDWEQEDDVAIITLERYTAASSSAVPPASKAANPTNKEWTPLAKFEISSQPGNERQAIAEVEQAVQGLEISTDRLERLKTAVGEATMNAMEHGNKFEADIPVSIQVLQSNQSVAVKITDQGGEGDIPEAEEPDLEAKLSGDQSPRGWGLFLIKNMVDEMNITTDKDHHTIELVMRLKGEQDARTTETS
ncbi:MAG: SpoIIE family protein phosphatase [Anaerolineales bacterium]|nr:SpoIIE family protein phosphatase [Anaerolineales bacterium]